MPCATDPVACVLPRPPITPLPSPSFPYAPPPPVPPGPPVHGSVVGIAVGSVAAAAVVLAMILCVAVALLRRRQRRRPVLGDHAATATALTPSTGSSNKLPSKDARPSNSVAALHKHQSIDLSPPPSSSSMSASSPSAASRESFQSHGGICSRSHMPAAAAAAAEILLFRGDFPYEELAAATNGFADSNLIGRGGFGDVYAGTVDGAAVAVKRLRPGSQQGDREFQAEVRIIGRVHHRNLVSLVGYCGAADGGPRLLVYEFVPNMTLEYHLHGEVQTVLDWSTRWTIAVGAAKGLVYLHEDCHPRIVHRDIKAANILLDCDFNPKIADFGMAKFIPGGDTHVSTRIVGTIGYLAPEYATSGRLTEKSDVFSFGVVLLELITGLSAAISSHPDTDETLVGWARPLLTQALEHSSYDDLVDPLLPSFDAGRMARLVRCAAAAVRSSARRRPRMSQIVRHLEGDASAEEINACGALCVGGEIGTHAADGGTKVQFHRPVRYDDLRMSRRQARERN